MLGELPCLMLRVEQLSVGDDIKDASAAFDQLHVDTRLFFDRFRQTDGFGGEVSLYAVFDRDVHSGISFRCTESVEYVAVRSANESSSIDKTDSRPSLVRGANGHVEVVSLNIVSATLGDTNEPVYGTVMPSTLTRNAHWSLISSMTLDVGLPAPCPARVSIRIKTGADPA
jgi:hypothetical protein